MQMNTTHKLPDAGYLRLTQIIGDKKANPPTTPIIPVCASVWWQGVKDGVYPQPVKLSKNITAWRAEDIRELIERVSIEGRAVA